MVRAMDFGDSNYCCYRDFCVVINVSRDCHDY